MNVNTNIHLKNKLLTNIILKYNILFIFFGCIILSSILSERFLTFVNLANIIKRSATFAMLACGVSVVLLTGEIDLSIGSQVAMNSVIFALLIPYGLWIAILFSILSNMLVGFINGILVGKAKMPSFIVTLAMMGITRALALTLAKGQPVYGIPERFTSLVKINVGPVPLVGIILLVTYSIMYIFLKYTYTGRTIYATGSSSKSAHLSGINIERTKILAFTICGLFAGLGGLIYAARINIGMPEGGTGYELQAITGAIIGGISLFGGVGEIQNVLIGVFMLSIFNNIMNLMNISPFIQNVIMGCVILVAVMIKIRQRVE